MDIFTKIILYFISLPGALFAFTIHEYTKAAASAALGDRTPANASRLTLNPLKHLEPVGFMCLIFFGLGWGKPVETRALGYRNRKKAEIIVYTLPSAINFLMALLFALASALLSKGLSMEALMANNGLWILYNLLANAAHVNMCYALFNLLPLYPLDAAKIVTVLRPEAGMWLKQNEKMLQLILMVLLYLGILYQVIGSASISILSLIKV